MKGDLFEDLFLLNPHDALNFIITMTYSVIVFKSSFGI